MEGRTQMIHKIQSPGSIFRRISNFVSDGVWDIELSSLSKIRRFGVKVVRVLYLVVKGFIDDQCPLHASALTFSTLMSIVPVLAVSLALARGFGAGDQAEDQIKAFVREKLGIQAVTNVVGSAAISTGQGSGAVGNAAIAASPVSVDDFSQRIDGMIAQVFDSVRNVSFATLGGVGLAILLWSVIQVLGSVEASFNKVWGVTSGRPIHRRFLDYLSVLIIVPVLAVAASSLPVAKVVLKFVDPQVAEQMMGIVGSGRLEAILVVTMTTLAFAFLIMFVPHTKVLVRAGLGGGFVTAILFIVWMKICIAIQIGVANSSKIYGSFAVVPIILFWVYVSWEIVLLGAEVAFALQNCTTYRMEMNANTASAKSRFMLALSVIRETSRAMLLNTPVFDSSVYAREKAVPVRLLNEVLRELDSAGMLAELSEQPGCYVLLKSPDSIAVKDVFDAVFQSGADPQHLGLNLGGSVGEILTITEAGVEKVLDKLTARTLATKA